jgi:hypothetical protein
MYTAIEIKVLRCTSTRPDRLKASTLSDRPVSIISSFWAYDCDGDRYAAALETLLLKLGDGWGKPSDWRGGNTNAGRVYVRS